MAATKSVPFKDLIRKKWFPNQNLSKQQMSAVGRWVRGLPGVEVQKIGKELIVFYNDSLPGQCPVKVNVIKSIMTTQLPELDKIIQKPTPMELAKTYIGELHGIIELLAEEVIRLRSVQMGALPQPSEKVKSILESLGINYPKE